MDKHLIVIGISVLLLTVGLSGCIEEEEEEKSTGKLVTALLSTLALTVDDLPQGYIKWNEDHNKSWGTMQDITYIEEYEAILVFESFESYNHDTGYPDIFLFLAKYNSSDEANTFLHYHSEQIMNAYNTLNRITPEDVEQIGNESMYELFQGPYPYGDHYGDQSVTISLSLFRINNVVVFLLIQGVPILEIDYTMLNIDYSKIVENRINASIEIK